MVFRKESKVDAFQRQISALRQQLGGAEDADGDNRPDERPADTYVAPNATDGGQMTVYGDVANAPATGDEGRDGSGYGFGSFAGSPSSRQFDASVVPSAMPSELETPEVPTMPVDSNASVISHDAFWKGDFQSEGSLHVHGRVEGTLRAKDGIFIAEEAEVEATIVAASVIIAGRVQGTIRCEARFEVLPQGRVTGEVQSPTLVIHEGALMNAQFRMGAPDRTESAPAPTASPVVHRRSAGSRG
jgi:cytoskeletal protein CcmA (bactofilin family)